MLACYLSGRLASNDNDKHKPTAQAHDTYGNAKRIGIPVHLHSFLVTLSCKLNCFFRVNGYDVFSFFLSSSSSRSIFYSSLALASYCARVEVVAALFFFSSASALASTSALISSTLTSQVEHVEIVVIIFQPIKL